MTNPMPTILTILHATRNPTGRNTTIEAVRPIPNTWAEVVTWAGNNDAPEAWCGPILHETGTHITLEIGYEPMTFLKNVWKVTRP